MVTAAFDSIRAYADNVGDVNTDSLTASVIRLNTALQRLYEIERDLEQSLELVLRPSQPTVTSATDGNLKSASSPSPIRFDIEAATSGINELSDRLLALIGRSDI